MAKYNDFKPTEIGKTKLLQAYSEDKKFVFTNAWLSSENTKLSDEEIYELTDLKEKIISNQLTLASEYNWQTGSTLSVRAYFTNAEVEKGFNVHKIGIYGKWEDELYDTLIGVVQAEVPAFLPNYDGVTSTGFNVIVDIALETANNITFIDNKDHASVGELEELQKDVLDLKNYLGYSESNVYGVKVNFDTNYVERLSANVGKKGGEDFNNVPMYQRRRCMLDKDGNVIEYYGHKNYNESGKLKSELTSSVTGKTYSSGTLYDIMVEQPKFYYRVVPLKTSRSIVNGEDYGEQLEECIYYISNQQLNDFKLHPAFQTMSGVVDKIYLSAFENTYYNDSKKSFVNVGDSGVEATYSKDMLYSINQIEYNRLHTANLKAFAPDTSTVKADILNQTNMADNKGLGWSPISIEDISVSQFLFLIEYASLNAQINIGDGVVKNTDGSLKNLAGGTVGNFSNVAPQGTPKGNNTSYRGQENIWGNGHTLPSNVRSEEQDGEVYYLINTPNGYERLTYRPDVSTGFIYRFGYDKNFDYLFLPTKNGGSSTGVSGDAIVPRKINANGVGVLLHGGSYVNSVNAGLTCYYVNLPLDYSGNVVSARTTYKPLNVATNSGAQISYRSHVSMVGWEERWRYEGQITGTQGEQIEAMQIDPLGKLKIDVRVYVEDIGWTDWYLNITKDTVIGTTGLSKGIQDIEISCKNARLKVQLKRNGEDWIDKEDFVRSSKNIEQIIIGVE